MKKFMVALAAVTALTALFGLPGHSTSGVKPDPASSPIVIYFYHKDLPFIEEGRELMRDLYSRYPCQFTAFEIDCSTLTVEQVEEIGVTGVPAFFFYDNNEDLQQHVTRARVYGLVPPIDLAEALLKCF